MLYAANCLTFVKTTLEKCDFNDLDVAMKQLTNDLHLSFKQLLPLLRLAITGQKVFSHAQSYTILLRTLSMLVHSWVDSSDADFGKKDCN